MDSAAILVFFSLIISNNLTEVGLGLENKIIQINLSHKKCFDKKTKQMKGHRIYMTDSILTRLKSFTLLSIKIMLNLQYNGAAWKVRATSEERLALIGS